MEQFAFKTRPVVSSLRPSTFDGIKFYDLYKDSEFLRDNENLKNILSNSFELKQKVKAKKPGETIELNGLLLEKNTPLILKIEGRNVDLDDFAFTFYRLSGLAAAYAFENRHRLPVGISSEATALGLEWDCTNEDKCRLYLSAVAGSQDFHDQFLFWPLICSIRKLQLGKTTEASVSKIANSKIRGETMAKMFMKNYSKVKSLWVLFPGASSMDLEEMLLKSSDHIKRLFLAD